MSRFDTFIALLDANVLFPAPLRDYLLHLASLGVYEPIWTEAIHDEWSRNLIKVRPDLSSASLLATRKAMNHAFPGANVSDYGSIIESLSLPDKDDRHVLAAAIKGGADAIITSNLKHFPAKRLSPYSIEAKHPDQFIAECIERDKYKAMSALKNQVMALKNPPLSMEKVLQNLEKTGLVISVAKLRQ